MAEQEEKRGGARPGAGRKPKDEKFKQPIAKAEKQIADRLPWLVDKMMELADGVYVEKMGLTGPVVYQQAPDYKAIAYLIDRIMGKPTERKEFLTPDKPLSEMSEDELRSILES